MKYSWWPSSVIAGGLKERPPKFELAISVVVIVWVGVLLFGPSLTFAQEVQTFSYRLDQAYIEASGMHDRLNRRWKSFRGDLKDNEVGVSTTLHLGLKGFVYHPRLVEWTARGGLTLKRRKFSNETANQSRSFDETLKEYDLGISVLKGRKLSLRIDSNRRTSTADGDFIAGTNIKTNGNRLTLVNTLKHVSQNLTISKNNYFSEGLVNNEEDRLSVIYQGLYRKTLLQSQAKLEYEDVDFVTARRGFTGKSARWQNTFRLSPRSRNSISGGLDYYSRNGSIANEFMQYNLSTSAQLKPDLHFSGSVAHRNHNVERVDSRVNTFSSSLTHQLYQSLTTSLALDLTSTNFGTGQEDEVSKSVNFSYNKQTFFGFLQGRIGHTDRRHEEENEELSIQSRTEEVTYSAGLPILLSAENIDSATVVVGNADSSSLFAYTPGIDYRVMLVAGRTEIIVEQTGAINTGDSLVISFIVRNLQGQSFEETHRRYGVTLSFARYLTIRADRMVQDQDPILGSSGLLLDNSRITEYSLGLNNSNVHFRTEYRLNKSGRNPYKLRAAILGWTKMLTRALQLSQDMAYSITDFPDQFSTSIVRTVNNSIRYQPSRSLSVITRGSYSNRSGRRDDGHSWVVSGLLKYKIELTTVELRADYYNRVTDIIGTDDRLNVELTIKRTIK